MNRDHVLEKNGETYLSPVGCVLLALQGWRKDGLEASSEALRRYCEYLAMHKYGKGTKAIMRELEVLDDASAAAWIESSFSRCVSDPIAAVEYVLGEYVKR